MVRATKSLKGNLNFWTPTEDQLQAWAVDYARLKGWKVFFFPGWAFRLAMASLKRARRGGRQWPETGWPDCVFMRNGKLVVAEFKIGSPTSKAGNPRPEQWEWLNAIASYGIPTYVWRPEDRDEIERILA
jgi:hypothetical protein